MSDCDFTLGNIMENPLKGFWQKVVIVSANGYLQGRSDVFNALIDPRAFHTCVSRAVMDNILETVVDKDGNKLKNAGKTNAQGVYGKVYQASVYILPHFYLGAIHLEDVAAAVLETNNIQCLIGRSILHQCILTLNPELNNMRFVFKEKLKPYKKLIDGFLPFGDVYEHAEFSGA